MYYLRQDRCAEVANDIYNNKTANSRPPALHCPPVPTMDRYLGGKKRSGAIERNV